MDIYEYYQEREERQRRAIAACEEAMQNIVQVLEEHKDKVERCWSHYELDGCWPYELDVRDRR